MSTFQKKIELIVPVFNEETCIKAFARRFLQLQKSMTGFRLHALFVNDGSTDQSSGLLHHLAGSHANIRVIDLARNFGHQAAITAGIDHADADYVVIIDADLQDPPELVARMVATAENENCQVVYAKRTSRHGENRFKKITASLFYKTLSQVCKTDIPRDTGDFRLLSREVVQELKKMRETHRFIRGMVPWIGYKALPVDYERSARHAGKTKYPFVKMLLFALDAIFSFSMAPLRLASYIGFGMIGFGFFLGLFVLYLKLATPYTVPGITAVLLTVIVLSGVQVFILGIMGEYVGRLFEASKGRPLYIIRGGDDRPPGQRSHPL